MNSATHPTSILPATPVVSIPPRNLLRREIDRAGSEARLAAAAGCSQVAINKAKRAASVSPWMALRLEVATGVPRQHWRPDLWPADGVPSAPLEPAAPCARSHPGRIARFRRACETQLAFSLEGVRP
ncbi:hypothetical protein [Bosea sp. BIWAKO-01]|uniref:hypothetical protein n=1 Tax=Bosea sp. BIWAKO-01 TaxID=506668 RepID=UPI000852E81E|nr:hypothetical protein [Bosea sp. BIWAKO-01]GAU86008.1 hypothetical protein BIWAKO_05956 [Bosea sp. BIWAKO-01]